MTSHDARPVKAPIADEHPEIYPFAQAGEVPDKDDGIDKFVGDGAPFKSVSMMPTEKDGPNGVDLEEIQMTDRGGREAKADEALVTKESHKETPVTPGKTFDAPTTSSKAFEEPTSDKKPPPMKPEVDRISFFHLFKYSSCCQKFLVWVGIFSAVIAGGFSPSIAIVFGEIVAIFDPNNDPEEIEDGIKKLFTMIGFLCAIQWVFGYLQFACLQSAAERLSFDLRSLYLSALLKQEPEFFEKQQVESLPSQIAEYFQAIGEGVGEKVGQLIYAVSMIVGGLAISFWYGPVFTLICLCYMPIMMGVIAVFGSLVTKKMKAKLVQTRKLGAHTEETLSALKLVVSFAQEDQALRHYDEIAEETRNLAKNAGVLQSVVHGTFLGFMFGFFLYSYAVGGQLIANGSINPATGEVYTVVEIIAVGQATMMSMMTLG